MKWWVIAGAWLAGQVAAPAQIPTALANRESRDVATIPRSEPVGQLARTLTATAKTDPDRVKALFTWVATHIQYDEKKGATNRVGFVDRRIDTVATVNRVLTSRLGVCTDFCLLLHQLLRETGFPCRIVTGYAKGNVEQAGTPVRGINHQWNLVFLDGRWQPLDATWASTNNGKRPLNLYYLLTPPEQFIATHHPDAPADQLLDRTLTKEQFDALPRIYDNYFLLGFGPSFPQQGLYQIRNKLRLRVDNPQEMEFMVLAHRYGKPQQPRTVYAKAYYQMKRHEIWLYVPRDGVYSVHLLSRPKGNPDDFKQILTYTVINN